MKLKFALVLFALLLGAIVVDEVSGDDGDSSKTPVNPTTLSEAPSSTTIETTTPQPGPVPEEQKDYILSFLSHGFNITGDNLFNYTWKKSSNLKPIFDYEKGKKEDFARVKMIRKFPSKQFDIYMHEHDLNNLLNATFAIKYPGNYSYRLYHSTYYGRVSAESYLSQAIYYGALVETKPEEIKKLLTEDFIKSVNEDLAEHKNYLGFLAKYGTNYFTSATFGGMFRMESHVTNKYVRDVSENGFKEYLEGQLDNTFHKVTEFSPPYDYYYHNHCENSTYGGDKKYNVSVPGEAIQWGKDLLLNDSQVVPIDFEGISIENLISEAELIPKEKNPKEIIEGLKKTIEIELNKFKVRSYMEAMDVVLKNPYGRSLGGSFDAQFLYSYFEGKLNETDVTLDEEFYDNAWAAEHNAQAILNRRGWFEKPYPPYPTTLPPTTEPTKPANATEAAATTEATTKKA